MSDQADQLRELVRQTTSARCAGGPPLVVVAGGRLGVGTTAVAIELSLALSAAGIQTLLVDADLQQGGATQRIFASQPDGALAGAEGLHDVLTGRRTAVEVQRSGPGGIRFLPCPRPNSPLPPLGKSARQRTARELVQIGPQTQAVVVDTAGGLTPWTERFWQAAQLVLVVTTPDESATVETYAMLKLAAQAGLLRRVRLLVNRSHSPMLADEVHQRIGQACYRFLGELVPAVPALPRVAPAGDGIARERGNQVDSAYSLALGQLTRTVMAELHPIVASSRPAA